MKNEWSGTSAIPGKAADHLRGIDQPSLGRGATTWQAVRDRILILIRSGEWPAGELVPTEMRLATEWGCARATVNRAMRDLAESGIVERRRKLGTRVTASMGQDARSAMFTLRSEISATGAEYGYRLVRFAQIDANAQIAGQLKLQAGAAIRHVSAVFMADETVYCGQETWLSCDRLPAIDDDALAQISVGEWLDHVARPNHVEIAILAAPVGDICAKAMGIAPGTTVLTIERAEWADATPLAFTRQYFPPGHRMVYMQ